MAGGSSEAPILVLFSDLEMPCDWLNKRGCGPSVVFFYHIGLETQFLKINVVCEVPGRVQ